MKFPVYLAFVFCAFTIQPLHAELVTIDLTTSAANTTFSTSTEQYTVSGLTAVNTEYGNTGTETITYDLIIDVSGPSGGVNVSTANGLGFGLNGLETGEILTLTASVTNVSGTAPSSGIILSGGSHPNTTVNNGFAD